MAIELVIASRPEFDETRTRLFAYFGGNRYEQVECDCDCSMPCFQLHKGIQQRCRIWKVVNIIKKRTSNNADT